MAEIKAKEELTGKVYASGKIVASFVSAKGSKGDKGDSSTITIGTTTTGESGTEAKVTNSGTSTAAIFDFVIPKGDKGDKGDRGADGTGVSILGSYASLSELQAAHPTGNIGDSYMIDGNLYVWSATTNTWNNVGSIKGEKGSPGIVVQENEPTDNDIYVWLDTDEEGEVLDYSTYENKIETVSVNGVMQSISNKNVDVKVPTKISQLEDDTEIPDTLYALGADYAECFEWEDGNPNNEDRRCLFVAIVDGTRKIRKAMNGDDVLGITSIDASVVGNAAYKDDNAYSVVGMVGVMKVKDNGQCEVGSYVIPGDNGLAIPSTNEAGYKVTARYSDDLIEVLLAHDSEMISRIKDDIKVIDSKIDNKIINTNSTSETDTYSCKYLNERNVIVSSEEPTTGEEVWLERSGNLFDSSTLIAGDIVGDYANLRVSSRQQLLLKAGTYKVTTNLSNTYEFGVQISPSPPPTSEYPTYIYDSKWTGSKSLMFTIKEDGWFVLGVRKADNTSFSLSEVTGFNYKLEKAKKIHTKTENGYEEFYNEEEHNKEIYSTSEQRIGTWVDLKPLYRKVINGTVTKNGDKLFTDTNIDTLTNMYGTIWYGAGIHQLGAYANENYYSLLQFNYDERTLYFYGASSYVGRDIRVYIEYTKKTD